MVFSARFRTAALGPHLVQFGTSAKSSTARQVTLLAPHMDTASGTDHTEWMSFSIAVLGLGEAGRTIATDAVALGVQVSGWDPVVTEVPGVAVASSAQAAASDATVILSVNSAQAAPAVARDLVATLEPNQVFADLNTGAPALKRKLEEIIAPSGAAFVDVALLTPVAGSGIRTPSLASGPGAERFVELMTPLGMPISFVDDQAGSAAARKLLRSIFIKGVHAAVLEGRAAASRLGQLDWYLEEVGRTFDKLSAADVNPFIVGSQQHALRRMHEMEAASELVRELGLTPNVSQAAAEVLRELVEDPPN